MCNNIQVLVYVIGYRLWCICKKIQVVVYVIGYRWWCICNKIQVMVYVMWFFSGRQREAFSPLTRWLHSHLKCFNFLSCVPKES